LETGTIDVSLLGRDDACVASKHYYEHVIRNKRDYRAVYDYIVANPINWEKDEEFSVS